MRSQVLPDETFDVVAVGAHPDDVEFACGGTLAKLSRAGYRVGIIDLTDGEPTPACPEPAVRRAEAERAAATLGVERRILSQPNRQLLDGIDARVELAVAFRQWRPRVVIGIGAKTPMHSPDHWQAAVITDAAVFYARLSKWPDRFQGLPEHTVGRQLYLQLGFDQRVTESLGCPLYVDIADTLAVKLESIKCYETQFPPQKQHLFKRLEQHAGALGSTSNCEAAEMLYNPFPVATQDLMGALFPS